MYEIKKIVKYLPVNLLGTGPRLIIKEFTGPQSHKFEKHCSKRIHGNVMGNVCNFILNTVVKIIRTMSGGSFV
jgi:hypothetical protein